MHLTTSFRLLPALALGILLLPGCYSRKDIKEEAAAETPAQVPPAEVPGAVAPPETAASEVSSGSAASTLARVNVFLEVSGSMEGFMPKTAADGANTRFQQHVAQFLSEVNRSSAARKTYFRIKEKPYRDSYQLLSQTVRSGIQQPASSTNIPTVLDTLVSGYYAPGTVNVLISDFIYSPKNAGAIPYISTDVTDALNRAQRPDLAVSVYGYSSDFRGTFYPALTTTVKKINSCCDTDIPYYFWVIGPAEAVRRFDATLLEKQPAQQAHFGVRYPVPASSLLSRFQNVGAWYYGEKDASKRAAGASYHTVAVSSVSAKEPVEFVVGLDLKTLPGLYRDVKYLKPNLQLQAQDADAKIVDVFAANDQTKNSSGAENQYTHFVKVRVTKLGKAARPLQLLLKNQRPAWISQWTTKNDSNINQIGAKTFALSSLVDGIAAVTGGEQDAPPVFVIPLTLQPAD